MCFAIYIIGKSEYNDISTSVNMMQVVKNLLVAKERLSAEVLYVLWCENGGLNSFEQPHKKLFISKYNSLMQLFLFH